MDGAVVCESWEHFEQTISSFMEANAHLRSMKHPILVSTPLFRGQACASWPLATTLDRMTGSDYSLRDYHRVIRGVLPAVVSITDKSWDVPLDFCTSSNPVPLGYEFMIYLRHHGFPSPLLDWSRSPYVAAYFAFRQIHKCDEENVAIYATVAYMGEANAWSVGEPTIFGLGPYVISHKRHYAQQCEYTICKKQVRQGEAIEEAYCSHEDAISKNNLGQDLLTRFVLPKSERSKALKKLELMNVTAFSLFGSEESLMETLAYQELEKDLLDKVDTEPDSESTSR